MATVDLTRNHAIPWDMGSAGKTCIYYVGILLWNATFNSKTWASSHEPYGRASVKRKKSVNPVQQHKAGCDRGKRTFIWVWQGKIWRVPAERTRAATSHTVISRALKLYLVSSLTSLRGGRRAPRFPSPPAPPLVRWFSSGKQQINIIIQAVKTCIFWRVYMSPHFKYLPVVDIHPCSL